MAEPIQLRTKKSCKRKPGCGV